MLKSALASSSILAVSALAAMGGDGFTYTSGFEDPAFPNSLGEVAGTDGWAINSGVTDLSFVVSSWSSGFAPASQAAGFGGYFSNPGAPGTVVDLTHPVSILLTSVTFDVDFAVMGADAFPGQDALSWVFAGSSNPLLRVAFEPPGGAGDLELAWYDNSGTRHLISPVSQDIFYDSSYHLNVAFSASGVDAAFVATLTGTGSVAFSGSLPGEGKTVLTDVGARLTVIDGSDSFLVFDNFSAVPEPQSACLVFLAFAGLSLRRRR